MNYFAHIKKHNELITEVHWYLFQDHGALIYLGLVHRWIEIEKDIKKKNIKGLNIYSLKFYWHELITNWCN